MKTTDSTYPRVNWIDGMKINKAHFIAMENSMLEIIGKVQQKNVSPLDYGLLSQRSEQESSLDVTISIDGQSTIEVVLNACRAVTLGGHQIEFTTNVKTFLTGSGHELEERYTIGADEKVWFVVLSVNSFQRVEVGESDIDEEPPRRPYVFPSYKLNVLPEIDNFNQEFGLHNIAIGKIISTGGTLTVDHDFIPPCRSVQSHPDLKFMYTELSSFLNQMESFSLHIIQKIHQKKQSNDLANIALSLSENVVRYLNEIITEFRLIDKFGPPIVMITKLVNLARIIKTSLDVFVGTGKENFLNYLTNWCDLNQGAFENVLTETIEMKYVHGDINTTIVKISSFTKLMMSLFKKLSELEYIGKKEDSGIFVKEESVEPSELKGRRSFLLD